MSSTAKHVTVTVLVLGIVGIAAAAAVVWSGAYNFAADEPHAEPVKALIQTIRQRSIAVRAAELRAPDLTDETRIVQGAGNYNAMCVGCHLAPGMEQTELSLGLYPTPADLTKQKVDPAHAFWVIKHGIKASGMPAWGKSMGDEYVWNMAAFLQKLPGMSEPQYREMVASSEGHSHGGGESGGHHSGEEMKGHHESGGDKWAHPHGAAPAEHPHKSADAHAVPASGPNADTQAETKAGPASAVHVHADGEEHDHAAQQPAAKTMPRHRDYGHKH